MKRRGNAIIIAMLMIAAVGGIAFGVGRLTIVDTGNYATYENGVGAFYAAESGAEEGLLRYKFDRNYTVPFVNWKTNEDKVYRTDLTSDTTTAADSVGIDPTNSTNDANQIYDLRMGYLGGTDGIYATSDGDYVPMNQDDETKIDLTGFNFSGNDINLAMRFAIPGGTGTRAELCKAMAQLKLTVVQTVEPTREYKELINYDPDACQYVAPNLAPEKLLQPASSGTNQLFVLTLSNVISRITSRAGVSNMNWDKAELSIKPLYYDAGIKVTPVNSNTQKNATDSVAGPFTTILSTGHYGGVVRKIITNIDRNSGTVYDLFDYVIYKKGS